MSSWLPGFLLALATLLLFVGFLLLGRYPGESVIHRTARILDQIRSARYGGSGLWSVASVFPSRSGGGRLIANSLASRGPPLQI